MNTAKLITLGILRGSGAVAAFSPLDITGLVLWLDASDSTTLFQDGAGTTPATTNNAVIGRWADKSTAGNHATQATTANKPLLKLATQNGRNTVLFDGTDDWLELPSSALLNGASPVTTYFVLRNDVNDIKMFLSSGFPNYMYTNAFRLYFGANETNTSAIPTGTYRILSVRATAPTAGNSLLYYNAISAGAGLASNSTAAAAVHYIGANNAAAQFPLKGPIAEMLIYHSAHTDAQFAAMHNYLNSKWAVY